MAPPQPASPRGIGMSAPAIDPPSTTSSWPVQYADSSDARNSTASASSSGVPTRRIGTAAKASGGGFSPNVLQYISVATPPGSTALTRIPADASSTAADFVIPRIAHFDAL